MYDRLLKDRQGVLFSFGAFASDLPLNVKRGIARAFARFPNYVFIWKSNDLTGDADFFSNITNIYRSSWLPQQTLLGK